MTPYWQSKCGNHVLYHGDCQELLKVFQHDQVDAVVTDPPYGLGERLTGGLYGEWSTHFAKSPEWDKYAPEGIVMALLTIARYQIIWGGNYYALPPMRGWMLWDKMQEHTSGHAEMAWTNLDIPVRTFRYSRVQLASEGKRHPTQKPLCLIVWCMSYLPDNCHTILDPFAGSGTTGVACVRTGKKSILCEIDKTYCDVIVSRMEAELSRPHLPGLEPTSKESQGILFDNHPGAPR